MKAALWLLNGTSVPGPGKPVLALDGKVARRSGDLADGLRPLHMAGAFLVREGLTLAREACDAKINGITALPRLPGRIHLEGAVVTIDAAGCQRVIVQALRAADADPAVKGHRQTLHRKVKAVFDDADQGDFLPEAGGRGPLRDRRAQRRPPRAAPLHGPGRSWPRRVGGGPQGVARPALPGPGAG